MPFTPPALDTEEPGGFSPPGLDTEEKFTPPGLATEETASFGRFRKDVERQPLTPAQDQERLRYTLSRDNPMAAYQFPELFAAWTAKGSLDPVRSEAELTPRPRLSAIDNRQSTAELDRQAKQAVLASFQPNADYSPELRSAMAGLQTGAATPAKLDAIAARLQAESGQVVSQIEDEHGFNWSPIKSIIKATTPELTADELKRQPRGVQRALAYANAVAGIGEFLTSPKGLMLAPTFATPLGRVGWAAIMGKDTVDAATDLGREKGLPKSQRDPYREASLEASIFLGTVFSAGLGGKAGEDARTAYEAQRAKNPSLPELPDWTLQSFDPIEGLKRAAAGWRRPEPAAAPEPAPSAPETPGTTPEPAESPASAEISAGPPSLPLPAGEGRSEGDPTTIAAPVEVLPKLPPLEQIPFDISGYTPAEQEAFHKWQRAIFGDEAIDATPLTKLPYESPPAEAPPIQPSINPPIQPAAAPPPVAAEPAPTPATPGELPIQPYANPTIQSERPVKVLKPGNVNTDADIPAAQASGNAAFTPKVAREQKTFLLDAVDQAIAEAPDRLPAKGDADTDFDVLDELRVFKAGDTRAAFDVRREEQLTPLFDKYKVPDRQEARPSPLAQNGQPIRPDQEAMDFNMAQRFALLEEAIHRARFDQREKVRIEVPGDGTFDIINTKSALNDFKERATKFPTSAGGPKKPSNARTSATAAAPLGTPSPAAALKALEVAAESAPDRVPIHQRVWSDGQQTVATNGRMLTNIRVGMGGTKANPKVFTLAGKEIKVDPEKVGERYPNWQHVIPEQFKFLLRDLNTEKLFTIMRQAMEATSEKSSSVKLWRNKDGSLGVTSRAPEAAEYVHNLPDPDTARVIMAIDPKYLVAAINSARRVGDKTVSLEWNDDLAPLKVSSAKAYSIIMPMRLSSPEPAARGGEVGNPTIQQSNNPTIRSLDSPTAPGPGGELGNPTIQQSTTPPPRSPADDPQHSVFDALPMELPEAVAFIRTVTGLFPKIRERMGKAAGRFIFTEGEGGKGRIELKASAFDLLTDQEKAALRQQAEDYAKANAEPSDDPRRMADERYEHLLSEAYDEAKRKNPTWALKVIWHEIGHWADWYPDKQISGRGNFFGHIASLKAYLEHVLPIDPNRPMGAKITPSDKTKLYAEAMRQLREELGPIQEIVRKIIVEEPMWEMTGITPEDVKNILRESAGKETPELTRWFAEQNSQVKAEVLRAAMKGFLDERLAALGGIKKQVGTRRVEKTVREKQGREPTPAELTQRFAELLRAEIRKRNLADLATVKAELEPLIAWWRGTRTMESYFASGEEMYAEAFSVFANNPAALEARAPTYAKLIWNYMERKPQLRMLYDKIQTDIRTGNIMPNRVKGLYDMWDRDDAASLQQARDSRRLNSREVLDNVSYHLDRRMGPVYRAAQGTDAQGRVAEAVGNFLYRMTEHERYLGAVNEQVGKHLVAHNLDWSHDLGEYLFHRHIIANRFNLANSRGWPSKNSFERLAEMERTLGTDRWAALVEAGKRFQALRKEFVVDPLVAENMFSPELAKVLTERADYATFSAIKDRADVGIEKILETQYGASVTPHIYRQIGNLGEIKNPATATILKGLSLISSMYRNSMKREVVSMLRENHPEDIMPAKMRWNGKMREPVMQDGVGVGTITYLKNGKIESFYTRKVLADAVNSGSPSENIIYSALMKFNGGLKGLFTQLNFGFWPFNFARDTLGWMMQMPGALTPLPWLKNLPRALVAARQSVTHNKPNVYAEAALARKMLITKGDPRGVWAGVENEYELKLASYGMEPAQWNKEFNGVRSFIKLWDKYKNMGQTVERVNKISGMLYLDEKFPDMPEWKKREIVRERSGSPNFLERGASNPAADLVFLFFNPWKEGVRSVIKAARENPASFTAKATVAILMPTILQSAGVNGYLGDDLKEKYGSIPDYDLSNYLCVPLAWVDKAQRKVAYLRLPLWEPARIAHGSVFQMLTPRGRGVVSHAGGQLPGLNPLFQVGLMWGEYTMGKNPVDLQRSVNVLTPKQFAAGGSQAFAQVAKQTWNDLGGGILMRFKNLNLESAPETQAENLLNLPGVNNALGRWLKVSDRGVVDRANEAASPVAQHRAQIQLGVDEILRRQTGAGAWEFAVQSLKSGDLNAFKSSVAAAQLSPAERLLMREPYAQEYYTRKFAETVASKASVNYRLWQNAKSNEERAALLKSGVIKK